jgi:hypothetical protein
MKSPTHEICTALAEHIQQRMDELDLDPTKLAAASGLSLPGLANVRKGYRRAYQKRLTIPLCRALKWTPDSIDRILAGGEPIVMDATTPSEDELMTSAEIRAEVARRDAAEAAFSERLAAIEAFLAPEWRPGTPPTKSFAAYIAESARGAEVPVAQHSAGTGPPT